MEKYFYLWIFFVTIRSLHQGFQCYKENRDTGYNKIHFETTGEIIEFNGSFGETISCTIASALGLLFSHVFLLITTLYFLPAAVVLFLILK